MKWVLGCIVVACSLSATADVRGDLIASLVNLHTAIQSNLEFTKTRCAAGKVVECKRAQLLGAQMATIEAEIALNRLHADGIGEEASEHVHRALRALDDADTELHDANEAIEP